MRMQVVGGERRAEAAAAVEDELLVLVGRLGDDVALDDAAAEVLGAARVAGAPLVVLAHVDEAELLAALLLLQDVVDGAFDDAALGVVDEGLELFRMIHIGVIFRRWAP